MIHQVGRDALARDMEIAVDHCDGRERSILDRWPALGEDMAELYLSADPVEVCLIGELLHIALQQIPGE